jgi:hypothetical protein
MYMCTTMKVTVIWSVTSYSLVITVSEEPIISVGSSFIRNATIYLPNYTASHLNIHRQKTSNPIITEFFFRGAGYSNCVLQGCHLCNLVECRRFGRTCCFTFSFKSVQASDVIIEEAI